MRLALQVLLRVVRRRVANGEALVEVLADYPKLTEAEKEAVRAAV